MVAAWYFVLFVTMGGGTAGVEGNVRSKSGAFFYATKTECTRVLDRIQSTKSDGDPFHSLLKHESFKEVHRHSWNTSCWSVPNRV